LAKRIPLPQALARSIAEAALLASVFTVLAVQELRFEGYETEKAGLLLIFAAIIIGANIAGFLQRPTDSEKSSQRRALTLHPLIIAAGALLVVGIISTLFSLSTARSFWGSPTRAQGLLTLCAYLVLFWQASRSGEWLRVALLPALLIIAVPLSLLTIVTRYGLDPLLTPVPRPGATTGNPDYLGSWLVMVTLYCSLQFADRVKKWDRPLSGRHVVQAALLGTVLFLVIFAFVLASSRAAMVGLALGALWIVVLKAVMASKRHLLLAIAVLGVVGGAGYVVASRMSLLDDLSGPARFLSIQDDFRVAVWEGAAGVVARQAEPLRAGDGTPDSYASMRPILGYGFDTTEQTQIRFDKAVRSLLSGSSYVDRFHNLMFDTLATLGWLGLLAWLGVYQVAFWVGLRGLGLLDSNHWWRWLGAQILGIPVGILFTLMLVPQGSLKNLGPVGIALGASGGALLWIGSRAFRTNLTASTEPVAYNTTLIAIFAVVNAQWIDNQFGFTQTTTQPLLWIMLGLLISLTRPESTEEPRTVPEANIWLVATLAAGVFLLHSLGVTVRSEIIIQQTGSPGLVLLLLVATWLVGIPGAALATPTPTRRRRSRSPGFKFGAALSIIGVWFAFFLVKGAGSVIAADMLDSVLATPDELSFARLRNAFFLLSLSGIGVAVVATGVFVGKAKLSHLRWRGGLIVGLFLFLGSLGYSRQYVGATSHRVGAGLSATHQADLQAIADVAFQVAAKATPTNARLRLHWCYLLLDNALTATNESDRAGSLAHLDEQIAIASRWEPFVINSNEWADFIEDYAALRANMRQP
jgi:hypothetical protein